jgi:2-polyprenyl-6-methoxyphenol hydroxylase-like FAD-dependent oxidoreductase
MIERAIITGGGIGGLCAAIGLHQTGIETVVYEQADKVSAVGAGLTLWANAIKALRKLGLADPVIDAGSKIERAEIRTASGRTLSRTRTGELEQLFGEPTIAIHRADLHDILQSALPACAVRLGEKCAGFEETDERVIARFAGGHSDQADLLVGADGIQSVIREQLFPEIKLRYAGYTAWRGVVATKDESALGLTSESWGRASRFGILRIDKERVYWFATANTPAGIRESAIERKGHLLQLFKGWHHPVELLLESTPADDILNNDIYDLPPMKKWGKGRVILLGDAAHPTTPNLGQGACMAIESSVVLARNISQGSNSADSLNRYELERMPRTRWITEQSWRIGRMGQLENPIACALRDFMTRVTPPKLVRKTLEKAAGYEV